MLFMCLPLTGPCAAEESSPCDPISSFVTKEAESKMSHDPGKETQPSCSLNEECVQSPLLVKQEQEGNSIMILANILKMRH